MRAATTVLLTLATLIGCDGDPEPRLAPEPEPGAGPAAAPAPEPPSPPAPWTVRAIRSCSAWASATVLATEAHLFVCDGAVFDVGTTRLVRGGFDLGSRIAARGTRSAWTDPGAESVLLRDGAGGERRFEVGDSVMGPGAFSRDGRRLALRGDSALRVLDLETGEVAVPEGAERCAAATAVGFRADGSPQCITRREDRKVLVTLGRAEEVEVPDAYAARWIPERGQIVARSHEALSWITDEGAPVAERAADRQHGLLAVREDGSALVTTNGDDRGSAADRQGRVERWWLEDGEVRTEVVYERAADRGAFVGDDEIALMVFENLVWLHRGPALELPELPEPQPPEGYERYRATEEHTFEGARGTFARAPHDVAMFGATDPEGGLLRVSRSDAEELAGFEGLDAWARAVMSRYVEVGTDRWAKAWTDEDGARVLRGHSYIGGCERTHIDVLVRERGQTLERWVALNGDPTRDGPFARIPDDAHDVEDGIVDRYAGDPSTGPLR